MSTNKIVKFLRDYHHPEIAPGLSFKDGDIAVIDPTTVEAILQLHPESIKVSDVDPDTVDLNAEVKPKAKKATKEVEPPVLTEAQVKAAALRTGGVEVKVTDPMHVVPPEELEQAKKAVLTSGV